VHDHRLAVALDDTRETVSSPAGPQPLVWELRPSSLRGVVASSRLLSPTGTKAHALSSRGAARRRPAVARTDVNDKRGAESGARAT
jgi:hypothetical protein